MKKSIKVIPVLLVVMIAGVALVWLLLPRADTSDSSVRRTPSSASDDMSVEEHISAPVAKERPDDGSVDGIRGAEDIRHSDFCVKSLTSAREEYANVFADLASVLNEVRASTVEKHVTRNGIFSGKLNSFASQGPESIYVDEADGFRDTKYGQRPDIRTVKKYTVDEVKQGIARNSAARWAILEHLRNSSGASVYEQEELIRLAMRWWNSGSKSELTKE